MVAKFQDLNKRWSCKYGRKNNDIIDTYDFPVRDCIHEQHGSAHVSSRKIVEIQKFWYYDDVIVNLRNRTGEERRRQILCDKRDNNFVWNNFSPNFTFLGHFKQFFL